MRVSIYRTYRFIDKDPVIDKMRTKLKDEGVSYKEASILSGCAKSTVDNLFIGDTRQPRHTTVAAIMTSIGYDQEWVKRKDLDFKRELEAAGKWWIERNKRKARQKPRKKKNGNGHTK